jgi:hypothetical protein
MSKKNKKLQLTPGEQHALDKLAALGPWGSRKSPVSSLLTNPRFLETFAIATPDHKANIFTTIIKSLEQLEHGMPCAVCRAAATNLRFLRVKLPAPLVAGLPANTESLDGITMVCVQHVRLRDDKLFQKVLELASKKSPGIRHIPRPAFVGPQTGGVRDLPQRCSVHTCAKCGKPVWIADQETDALHPEDGEPVFLCADCASMLQARGDLRQVIISGLL